MSRMDPSSSGIISDQPAEKMENIKNMDGALYRAAAQGKIEKFRTLERCELESLRTPIHNTVVHILLLATPSKSMPNVIFIEKILSQCPSLLQQPNAEGQTPLHIAARYGHSVVVEFLINYYREKLGQGDVERQQGMELEAAVREMIRKEDKECNTALHLAVQYGRLDVVKKLLEFEDPNYSYSPNRNKETPLYIAARRGKGCLASEILKKFNSASVAYGCPHGRTALHAAVMSQDEETTRIILEEKGDLTRQTDERGQTPLHYAAHLGYRSIVKVLLKWDKSAAYIADDTEKGMTGMTALLMAARQGHGMIIQDIMSYCPDCCEIIDKKSGWNLLHFVAVRRTPLHIFFHALSSGEPRGNSSCFASIRNLIDQEDMEGNRPIELFFAINDSTTLMMGINKVRLSSNKKEQILKDLKRVISGEVAEVAVSSFTNPSELKDTFDKAAEQHLVVATLIATVTFTAGITLPGGYINEKGAEQGTATLIRNVAFKAFVISDALALVLSLFSVFLNFQRVMTRSYAHEESFWETTSLSTSISSTYYAIWALMVAFSTGTYAVLQPSSGLAIATCCISLSFFCFALFGNYTMIVKPKLKLIRPTVIFN